MSPTAFKAKWSERFADNDTFEIDEGDLREFTADVADTFGLPIPAGDLLGNLRLFTGTTAAPQPIEQNCYYIVAQRYLYQARSTFNASATPTQSSAYWRLALSSPDAVAVLQTLGSSTTATVSQRVLTEKLEAGFIGPIAKNQYGLHPTLLTGQAFAAYVLQTLSQLLPTQVPGQPQNGQVDDVANTFSAQVVIGFPALVQYEGYGFPGIAGIVPLTSENAYLQNGRVYLKGLTGPLEVEDVGFRVAASGSQPAGPFAMNKQAFTGPIVTVSFPYTFDFDLN